MEYRKRIADKLLKEQLEASGAVLIEGPKWCGKTTTAEQQAQSRIYMNDPETEEELMLLASTNIKRLLTGASPRLIDEWQMVPRLWDAVRFEVDHRNVSVGQFILTGSAVPASTEQISFVCCRGGWPAAIGMKPKAALRQAYNYVDAICNTDISRVDGVRRESAFCRRLLRSYARHSGTSASLSTLYADIVANESSSMNENTIASYLQALRKIFVVEDMPAWNPNLRSKSAIRTSDTRYFVDPSVATSALGIGPNDLSNDLKSFGFIFETLAVRDLRVYAEALDGEVFHFRDRNGLECDAVVHLRNGSYGLVEVKIGGEKLIEEGASSLKSLAGKIDTERMKKPSFMMVLTGIGTYAYKREDGVYVVPVCALKD